MVRHFTNNSNCGVPISYGWGWKYWITLKRSASSQWLIGPDVVLTSLVMAHTTLTSLIFEIFGMKFYIHISGLKTFVPFMTYKNGLKTSNENNDPKEKGKIRPGNILFDFEMDWMKFRSICEGFGSFSKSDCFKNGTAGRILWKFRIGHNKCSRGWTGKTAPVIRSKRETLRHEVLWCYR